MNPGEGAEVLELEADKGDAANPKPGGRRAKEGDERPSVVGKVGAATRVDGGLGARRAVLTMARDGRRRLVRYGKRKPLGRQRERLSANCASIRCSSQSCVTDSSV